MVGAALAIGWMSASLTQDPPPAQTSRNVSTRRALGTTIVPQAEKLRERMKEPALPARGRNPFVYGSRASRPSVVRNQRDQPDRQPPAPPLNLEPPAPTFKLSGIASSMVNGTNVLTAIVIDNGSMVFVKTGEKLSRGYSVVRVDELSVTIVDADGVTQTLRLP
jgi:hypothetical protein